MGTAILGLLCLLALILLRLPIAFAMLSVGFVGVALVVGFRPALSMVGQIAFDTGLSYELSVLPLFILMGNFVTRAGLSEELYAASNAWLGHRPGGLAMATIVACGGFSAVCGSSLATAATMAKVAMPPMRRYRYAPSFAAGSIAAGGTLGILIPPSVVLVLYGTMTSQDIGQLFAAGLVPGLVGVAGYVGAVRFVVWRNPSLGPRAERVSKAERRRALARIWGVLTLFAVVMGGIYGGVFTPTEAAGIGAGGGFLFAAIRKRLTWSSLFDVLNESTQTTAMLFLVLMGALVFSNFLNLAGLPSAVADGVGLLDIPPLGMIGAILVVFLLMGCVLESLSMVLLLVPVTYPLVAAQGFDLIWFGILVVTATEISLITPPIGLNVFVLKNSVPEVTTAEIFRGVIPFWCADLVRLALLVAFPWLALALPWLLRGVS